MVFYAKSLVSRETIYFDVLNPIYLLTVKKHFMISIERERYTFLVNWFINNTSSPHKACIFTSMLTNPVLHLFRAAPIPLLSSRT